MFLDSFNAFLPIRVRIFFQIINLYKSLYSHISGVSHIFQDQSLELSIQDYLWCHLIFPIGHFIDPYIICQYLKFLKSITLFLPCNKVFSAKKKKKKYYIYIYIFFFFLDVHPYNDSVVSPCLCCCRNLGFPLFSVTLFKIFILFNFGCIGS